MATTTEGWWQRDQQIGGAPGPSEEHAALGRTPSLAGPFAAFGAAAGLFAILALGAFREAARDVSPLAPMLTTGLAGALAGVTLRRWRSLHRPDLAEGRFAVAREALIARVGVVSAAAGAASGAAVGLFTWGADGVARFAVGGALVGLLFLPSCLVVFDAARRAGRGRHGSLVAAADRRTVVSTVLAGIAFAGATPVPALLNAEVSNDLEPATQAALSLLACLGATIAIAHLQRRDRQARAAFEAFAKDASWLDRVESEEALPPSAVDLGIGAEQWARTSDAGYRTSGRAPVLVKGSIEEASAAFADGVRRRHHALLIATSSITAVAASCALRLSVLL